MKSKVLFLLVLFSISIGAATQTPPVVTKAKQKDETNSNSPKNQANTSLSYPKAQGVITRPESGEVFDDILKIFGRADNIPNGKFLWLLKCPHEFIECWPQFKNIAIDPVSGEFEAKAEISGPGLFYDIKLVLAGHETHSMFLNYLVNYDFNNGIMPPDDVITLSQITVNKAENKERILYGVSYNGVFFIHSSLIEDVNGSAPILVSSLDGWENDYPMKLSGDYYVVKLSIQNTLNRKIDYCFRVADNKYIPHALLNKFSPYIKEGEYVSNGNNGYNFRTMPLDILPF